MSVPIPERMLHLRIDPIRNLPIPWFVPMVDGKPEWRAADGEKRALAFATRACWICGYPIRREDYYYFVLGPMCGLNRISAEPAMHGECAFYSVKACPFLTRPRLERRPLAEGQEREPSPGIMLERNPGCCAVWVTRDFQLVNGGEGGLLVQVGDPLTVQWYAEGRLATREQVLTSIITGIPHLKVEGPEQWEELARLWLRLDPWLPGGEE